MKERSYLDYNATAPLRPAVRQAMVEALELYGNPSSVHAEGRAARAAVESARAKVAALVGARADQVIFTSGGSEANALALAQSHSGYVSAIEHPSVLSGRDTIETLPVSAEGVLDLDAVAALLAKPHLNGEAQPLFSVMRANNETGALQPVSEVAEMVHQAGGRLHSDAVQAAGKIAIDFSSLGADFVSLSAHKLGGPKGIGALVVADGVPLQPLIRGGTQETRRRAGTENILGIVGFGASCECAAADLAAAGVADALKTRLEREALAAVPEAITFSAGTERLPNTLCISVPGTKAETLVIGLDLAGIAVSSGSACSSGKVARSHVLAAMGVPPELADGAIRVSLGWDNTEADVDRFLAAWTEMVKRLQQRRRAA